MSRSMPLSVLRQIRLTAQQITQPRQAKSRRGPTESKENTRKSAGILRASALRTNLSGKQGA